MDTQAPVDPHRRGLEIHLLGKPWVGRDGCALPAPRGIKVWGLLAYLVHSQKPASRRHLADLLFEDAEDPLAALRWNLSELRRLLGEAGLRGDTLALALEPATYVDIKVVTMGTWMQALHVPSLDRELLEGLSFPSSPAFEVWLSGERRHFQATTEAILHEAALARLAAGAANEAVEFATRLVRSNPLDENYQALLVRSLAAAGDGIGAARQASVCRELFLRQLGVPPGATLDAAMRTATDRPTTRASTGRVAALAQLEAGEAAIGAGALDAGLHCLRRAIVEADITGDPILRGRARIALGGALVHAARGRDEEGATALHEALAVLENASPLLAAAACRELAYVEFLRGRYDRSLPWLCRAVPLAGTDHAELARIETVHGSLLSDTAHYGLAIAMLQRAVSRCSRIGDVKQLAYALSMLGRALTLYGDLEAATAALDQSLALARTNWTAFVPWPQSLRAEIDLMKGDINAAADRLEHAFALGCQLGDPCWEGIAGRGLGCVALARGDSQRAIEIFSDTIVRCVRLPDAYLWGKGYALDALCGLAVSQNLPQASGWISDLQSLAGRSGMRELTVRSCLHRAALGDVVSGAAAQLLVREIDNPVLHAMVELQYGSEGFGNASQTLNTFSAQPLRVRPGKTQS